MNTQMAQTSLAAFRSLGVADYLQPKEREVMAAFYSPSVALTRQAISAATGMPLHCVCGRVRSLLDKGVLTVRGTSVDPQTRKHQELLGVPVYGQASLF